MDSVEVARLVIAVIAGYLFGSLPLAYLAARVVGVNIFEVGTGNPGAANTFRAVSRKTGHIGVNRGRGQRSSSGPRRGRVGRG